MEGSKFPFYHSQILFEELNRHILFSTQYSSEKILRKLEGNTNIIIPTTEELTIFYETFARKINENKNLKELFIDENYKARIFDIYESIKSIEKKLTSIEGQLSIKLDQDWFNKQWGEPRPVYKTFPPDLEESDYTSARISEIESYISYVYDEDTDDSEINKTWNEDVTVNNRCNLDYKDKPLKVIVNPWVNLVRIG